MCKKNIPYILAFYYKPVKSIQMNESCQKHAQRLSRVKETLVKLEEEEIQINLQLKENPIIPPLYKRLRDLEMDKKITRNEIEDCEELLEECIAKNGNL